MKKKWSHLQKITPMCNWIDHRSTLYKVILSMIRIRFFSFSSMGWMIGIDRWITHSVPNILVIQLFIPIIHSIDGTSFLLSFFVDMMKYCWIGTAIIVHCVHKEIFSSSLSTFISACRMAPFDPTQRKSSSSC